MRLHCRTWKPNPARRIASSLQLAWMLMLLASAAAYPMVADEIRAGDRLSSALLSVKKSTDELPRPREVLQVASSGELLDAVTRASGGDHIVLKDGVYEGDLDLARTFPDGEQLVIRAETTLGAKATGRWRVPGNGIVLSGLAWEGAGAGVRISGSHVRLTRCAVRQIDTGEASTTPRAAISISNQRGEITRSVTIDHCDISGYGIDGIDVAPDGTIEGVRIERNHIHGGALTGGGHNLRGNAIGVGIENGNREKSIKAIIAWNLIEDHRAPHAIHVKSSDNVLAFNTVRKAKGKSAHITVRHGRSNTIIGNTVDGGRISTYDYRTMIAGNKARQIWLQAGNLNEGYSFDELKNKREAGYGTRPASRNALVVGNEATLVIGQHFDHYCKQEPTPVEGATIYQHVGKVKFVDDDCTAWHKDIVSEPEGQAPADWGPLPGPSKLLVRDVGPFATGQ